MEEEITEAELYDLAVNTEITLKKYAQRKDREGAINDFLNNIVEARREQILRKINERWMRWEKYIFILSGGELSCYICNGTLKVAGGGKVLEYQITDGEILEFLRDVESYLRRNFL